MTDQKRKQSLFAEGRCKRNKYCAFRLVFEDRNAIAEICFYCGRRVVSRRDWESGRIASGKYLRTHIRDFCQPTGATHKVFAELYGMTAIKSFDELAKDKDLRVWAKSPERRKERFVAEARDYYRALCKTSI